MLARSQHTALNRPLQSILSQSPNRLPTPFCAQARSYRPVHPIVLRQTPQHPKPLESSVTVTAICAGIAFIATGYFVWEASTSYHPQPDTPPKPLSHDPDYSSSNPVDPLAMPVPGVPPTSIGPGRPGNLTPDQEAKLKELWVEIGKLTGQYPEGTRVSLDGRPSESGATTPDDMSSTPGSVKEKKKRRFFGRSKNKDEDEGSAAGEDVMDKHGSNKEFKQAIQSMTKQELREELWAFCKCDDPDASICRYLRARKWNVHDALVMLVSTIYWRARVMKLDADVMAHGEEQALRASRGETQGTGGLSKQLGHDMIEQLKMGKSFLHGVDKEGRPLCIVRVRLHKGGEHSEESLNRLTVFMIETARFMLRPPIDTAVIIFDMTGFSLANMDYTPVKFMIKVFEANYPESLGAVLVHKAPWVFQGVWSIIKGWLDPVVASKISFTKHVSDMEKYIDVRNIPKELDGQEDFEYSYVPPVEGENVQMQDTQARQEVQQEREGLLKQFEQNTEDWVMANRSEGEVKAERRRISQQLHDNYWRLDPFVRSRSMYDRTGVIQEGGKIDMYPPANWTPPRKNVSAPAARPSELDGTAQPYNAAAAPVPNGTGLGGGSQAADTKSLRSVKSVYYDAQDELD